jgi:hypothetical protein
MNQNNKLYLDRVKNKEIKGEPAKVVAVMLNPNVEVVEDWQVPKHRADKGEKRMKYSRKINPKYAAYINRANGAGKSFELTIEEFDRLMAQECVYCGTNHKITIDRLDSRYGYNIDNVQTLCLMCNCFKGSRFAGVEMEEQLFKIIRNFAAKGKLKDILKGQDF